MARQVQSSFAVNSATRNIEARVDGLRLQICELLDWMEADMVIMVGLAQIWETPRARICLFFETVSHLEELYLNRLHRFLRGILMRSQQQRT